MKNKKLKAPNSDAIFIGWQETLRGDVFPLFNITKENHPLIGATVSEDTLIKMNLRIPRFNHSERNIVLRYP